jgi:hypothetical protein
MARFDTARFMAAATAYADAHGATDAADTAGTRERCAALAAGLPEAHAARKGLESVVALRASIARRFITLGVAPIVAARPVKRTRRARKGA